MHKSLAPVALALTICLSSVSLAYSQDQLITLTNADVLTMIRAKLPAAVIIEKINNSSCHFDTFPSVLSELKYKGVPDDVLMAMVQAPAGIRPKRLEEPKAELRAESRLVSNVGGVNLPDRSETPYNARFFVAPMDEDFDGLISALMLEKKLPLSVVADETLADFIVIGGTNKGSNKRFDTLLRGCLDRVCSQGTE